MHADHDGLLSDCFSPTSVHNDDIQHVRNLNRGLTCTTKAMQNNRLSVNKAMNKAKGQHQKIMQLQSVDSMQILSA